MATCCHVHAEEQVIYSITLFLLRVKQMLINKVILRIQEEAIGKCLLLYIVFKLTVPPK